MNNHDYWFPWYPSLFQSNTLDLTLEQDAIYRRLIDHYMLTREPLPESFGALARIAGCPIETIEKNAAVILTAYFTHTAGTFSHAKCDEILDEQDARTNKKSKAGKKAAEKRWSKAIDKKEKNAAVIAVAKQTQCESMQQDKDRTKTETVSKKDVRPIAQPDDLQAAVDLYNETAIRAGLSACQTLSQPRKSKLAARLKDCGGLEGWRAAMGKIENSRFLTGKVKPWKASFDFILQESSFIKIMEGAYDDNSQHNEQPKSRTEDLKSQADRLMDKYRD